MEKDVNIRLRVNCCDTCAIRCGLPDDLCPLIGLSPVSYLLSALAEASKKVTDEEIKEAYTLVDEKLLEVIRKAKVNIKKGFSKK